MPPKKKTQPPHVSLYRIEEERKNVVRRTQTRLATLQGTSVPVHQTLTPILHVNDAQEQLPVNDAPIPGYITFPFGFCVGILLLYTALSFAYLNNCECSCT
jgi:hypothetical protein